MVRELELQNAMGRTGLRHGLHSRGCTGNAVRKITAQSEAAVSTAVLDTTAAQQDLSGTQSHCCPQGAVAEIVR
jgi:hypothetical protein